MTRWLRVSRWTDGSDFPVAADPAADPEVQTRVLKAAERYFDKREERAELHIEGEDLCAASDWVRVLSYAVLSGEVTLTVEAAP